MASTQIPKVEDTDLDRDELVEAAEELDLDHESLDDQELFEELGRRLGEIDDDAPDEPEDEAADAGEERADAPSDATADEDTAEEVSDPGGIRQELEGLTRNEVRDRLRDLGLPVAGNKADLIDRLEAARIGAARAGGDVADEATDAAEDAAAKASDTAEDTAEKATDTAEDTAEKATDTAEDTAGTGTDAPDRQAARDAGEYRVENDEREDIAPILDLELGPLALDILGLDVHLNRIHAVLVANPGPKHALLGKLLSGVAKTTDKLGLNSAVGGVTDGVEKVVDALPTPATGADGGDDEDDDERRGVLGRVKDRIAGAGRAARSLAGHTTDAAGSAKDATVDAVTSGGKLQAAKEGKDAVKSVKHAAGAAKDVATGSG
jgi:hypothetical protein